MDNRNLFRNVALGGIVAAALFAAAPGFAALPSCGPADINGTAMPAGSAADRTVKVTPNMKRVNVGYGQTVKFVLENGQESIWKFDGIAGKLNLGTVLAAPSATAGASAAAPGKDIPIYVDQSKNPLTSSCGGY